MLSLSWQDVCPSASFSQVAHLDVSSGAIPASSEMPLLWRTLPRVTSPPWWVCPLDPLEICGSATVSDPSKRQGTEAIPGWIQRQTPRPLSQSLGLKIGSPCRLLTFLFANRPHAKLFRLNNTILSDISCMINHYTIIHCHTQYNSKLYILYHIMI